MLALLHAKMFSRERCLEESLVFQKTDTETHALGCLFKLVNSTSEEKKQQVTFAQLKPYSQTSLLSMEYGTDQLASRKWLKDADSMLRSFMTKLKVLDIMF